MKKKLAKLKLYKAYLPRLIDCSNVCGDDYYSEDDLSDVSKHIEEVEKQIDGFRRRILNKAITE